MQVERNRWSGKHSFFLFFSSAFLSTFLYVSFTATLNTTPKKTLLFYLTSFTNSIFSTFLIFLIGEDRHLK